MDKCIERKKRFLFWEIGVDDHHAYQDVYDTEKSEFVPRGTKLQFASSEDVCAWKTYNSNSTYIKSICTHCGHEIIR